MVLLWVEGTFVKNHFLNHFVETKRHFGKFFPQLRCVNGKMQTCSCRNKKNYSTKLCSIGFTIFGFKSLCRIQTVKFKSKWAYRPGVAGCSFQSQTFARPFSFLLLVIVGNGFCIPQFDLVSKNSKTYRKSLCQIKIVKLI